MIGKERMMISQRGRPAVMTSLWSVLIAAFVCGAAAISINPCPECQCMAWTPWINADTPLDKAGDVETLRFGKPGYGTYITDNQGNPGSVAKKLWKDHKITCNHPIQIECRDAVTHQPFVQTGDFTTGAGVKCTTDQGFICLNSQQQDGICKDYEVRLLCWQKCLSLKWTPFTNNDSPGAVGDFELHQMVNPQSPNNYEPCPSGSSPYEIQCQRKSDGMNALLTGQKNLMCDRNWGFACVNDPTLTCDDYEVRYLCLI